MRTFSDVAAGWLAREAADVALAGEAFAGACWNERLLGHPKLQGMLCDASGDLAAEAAKLNAGREICAGGCAERIQELEARVAKARRNKVPREEAQFAAQLQACRRLQDSAGLAAAEAVDLFIARNLNQFRGALL